MTDMHKAITLDEAFEALDDTKLLLSAKHRGGDRRLAGRGGCAARLQPGACPSSGPPHFSSASSVICSTTWPRVTYPATFATLTAPSLAPCRSCGGLCLMIGIHLPVTGMARLHVFPCGDPAPLVLAVARQPLNH